MAHSTTPTQSPPSLLSITNREGTGPSGEFGRLYKDRIGHLLHVFPSQRHNESAFPPNDPQQFFACFVDSPRFHQQLSAELWTMLHELGEHRWHANKHTMYDHQRAHIAWVAAMLAGGKNSPKTFLLEGAPGIGKTLELGIFLQAFIRVQARTLLASDECELGAYLTNRNYYLPQQISGIASQLRRVLHAQTGEGSEESNGTLDASTRQRNKLYRYCKLHFGDEIMGEYFPKKIWQRLFSSVPADEGQATLLIRQALGSERIMALQRKVQTWAEMFGIIASLMMRAATMIRDKDQVRIIDLPELPKDKEDASFGGDAGFGVPADWPVLTRAPGMKSDTSVEPRLVFATNAMFGGQGPDLNRDLLQRMRLILVDEARRTNGSTFTQPVVESPGRKNDPPVVIAATALRYPSAQWDASAPALRLREATEANVLPHVGIRVFPGADAQRYPHATQQALDQCIEEHFRPSSLPQKLGLPSPHRCNTLFVVPPMFTRQYEEALTAAYKKHTKAKEGPAHILCLDGRTPSDEKSVALLWFLKQREGPNILIASPTVVTDSLDLTNIEHLVIAAPLSDDVLERLTGRLTHSKKGKGGNERCYISQQLFIGQRQSIVRTLPHGLTLEPADLRWPPMQRVFSESGHRADTKHTRKGGYGETLIPDVTGVTTTAEQRTTALETATPLVPIRAIRAASAHSPASGPLFEKIREATGSEPVARLLLLARDIAPGTFDSALGGYFATLSLSARDITSANGQDGTHAFKKRVFGLAQKRSLVVSPRYLAEYRQFLRENASNGTV